MSFQNLAGRILIADENGDITFDTDERQLIFTDYVEGQLSTPTRTATSQNGSRTDVNVNLDTVVAAINPAAEVVLGGFKVTRLDTSGIPQLVDGGWFQATGSYLNGQGTINSSAPAATPYEGISCYVVYTFRCQAGQLIFNERAWIRTTFSAGSVLLSTQMSACTVDYKLYCGAFV